MDLSVLVVDDDVAFVEGVCRGLRAAGYGAVGLTDGAEALRAIAAEPPDNLITDIFMPDVEGLETIREIRRLRPDMPIIAISGIDFDGGNYLAVARKFGAMETLKKPFWPDDLVELVSRMLSPA